MKIKFELKISKKELKEFRKAGIQIHELMNKNNRSRNFKNNNFKNNNDK